MVMVAYGFKDGNIWMCLEDSWSLKSWRAINLLISSIVNLLAQWDKVEQGSVSKWILALISNKLQFNAQIIVEAVAMFAFFNFSRSELVAWIETLEN